MTPIPFLDLQAQYQSIKEEMQIAINEVLDTSHYVLGPKVADFEKRFAEMHSSSYCVGTNNGTSALHVAFWAAGIGPGDEVILPVNTFIATAEAVTLCGATAVFVDHDDYFNIDPECVSRAITSKTKAIIAVHLYGQIARMDELTKIARIHNVILFEDAAQAHLSEFDGKSAGSWGLATGFSFYPGKNLGAYGEAGAVLTQSKQLYDRMRMLRDHGSSGKYNHLVSGQNYRMEAIQGAVLGVKLGHLKAWTDARRRNADHYEHYLGDCDAVALPWVHPSANPVWHLYVIRAEDRDGLKAHLESQSIATGLHYPIPLHLQPAFASLGYKEGSFPMAEAAAKEILSLPMFPELTESQISQIATEIKKFYQK
jgi:dTDP-4-amino-4,6-dideoxygalactose transaminase